VSVETYRIVVIALAGFSIFLNLFVAFQWTRAWFRSTDAGLRHTLRGPLVYPLMAAATLVVGIYWRLNDAALALPLGIGDFTVLVPTLGFLIAAWVSLGNYARVEILMTRLTKLEAKEQATA
jgi:hypothetical protein